MRTTTAWYCPEHDGETSLHTLSTLDNPPRCPSTGRMLVGPFLDEAQARYVYTKRCVDATRSG